MKNFPVHSITKQHCQHTFLTTISIFALLVLAGPSAFAGPTSDTTAPRFDGLTLTSTSIDASQGTVTQHITAHIVDDLSGTTYAGAYYSSYVNGVNRSFNAYFNEYNRVSGTAQDGFYDTTLTIPQYAAQGKYDLNLYANDAAGNNRSWWTGELGYLGPVTSLEVTSIGDTQAPTFQSLTLGATSVDASKGSVTQHIVARITDALAGVTYAGAYFSSYVNGVNRSFNAYFNEYNRVSGTAQDGVYDTTLTIPQYAAQGKYDLNLYANDAAGNNRSWWTGELGYLGPVTSLEVTSIGDTQAPTFQSLTLGASIVDASQGSVTQHITAHIVDDLSGTTYAGAYYSSYVNGVNRSFNAYFNEYNRVSGTAQDGFYDTTLTIPQYAAEGKYDLNLYANDAAGNNRSWWTGELGYLVGATQLTVSSTAVPEPASIALFFLGLLALLGVRRKA